MAYPYSSEKGFRDHPMLSELRKRGPDPEKLQAETLAHWAVGVSAAAALAAHKRIAEAYGLPQTYSAEEREALKVAIDQAAVTAMEQSLNKQTTFRIRSVGSEGAKEVQYVGAAAPTVEGSFGPLTAPARDIVTDAVEGTTAASKNLPGAVSIIAMAECNGILASQESQFYLEKLFGPPALHGKISLEQPPLEILQIARELLGSYTVVVLNRPRNQSVIDAARQLELPLHLIEAGDLIPSILAASGRADFQGRPTIVMGSGGYEEGVIAAAAAKALGGVSECRVWSKDQLQAFPVLKQDHLVAGPAEEIVVSATAITSDPWFGLKSPQELHVLGLGENQTETLVVTKQGGLQIIRTQPIRDLR